MFVRRPKPSGLKVILTGCATTWMRSAGSEWSLEDAGADLGRVDGLANHPPLEQPTKKNNAWKNKRKYLGPKNLVKPSSLANVVTIDRNVVCEKFTVALHPRRMTASSLLAHLGVLSKVFLLASISSISWRFKSLQCYSLQIRVSLMGRKQTLQTRSLRKASGYTYLLCMALSHFQDPKVIVGLCVVVIWRKR